MLCSSGHRVTVVSRANHGAPLYEESEWGFHVWRVGIPLWRKRVVGRTLDRMLHARAVSAKVRKLDGRRAFDVIEAPEAGLDGEVLAGDSAFVGRLVVACHGSNRRGQSVRGLLAPLHRLDWAWSCRRERVLLSRARTIVANSEATKREVFSVGASVEAVDVVHLGIDPTQFFPGERNTGETLHIGFVGRLQEDKGIDFVWRVLERLESVPGLRFHLRGAIHAANRTETLQNLKRFDHLVQYHPPGPADEMPDFYRSLDVLLLPSRFESFGLAYVEAMATELLVFAGLGGAAPEVVSDGETGFLVDPDGSPEAVVQKLISLAEDRYIYDEIRACARRAVLGRFTLREFEIGKLAIYSRTIEGAETLRGIRGVSA